jgi:hypothetical protein
MSDEQRKDEIDVEGHAQQAGANDEPADDDAEDEIEAHIYRAGNVRMD